MKLNLDKPFYLIAKYWLGDIKGFIKLGDDRKEIEYLTIKPMLEKEKQEYGF